MGHLGTHHHQYETVRTCLDPYQMAKLVCKIQGSKVFELGELSHINLRGTDTCVGYLGDESAELVDSSRRLELRPLRKKLRRYFNFV